jgi:uncharacterized protein
MPIYVDTSALAKRYVSELGSDVFEAFVNEQDAELVICPLGATEFESMLLRLRRQRLVSDVFVAHARKSFADDLAAGLWALRPFMLTSFSRASELMRNLSSRLTTLDALHLAQAQALSCDAVATGDRDLARAVRGVGLTLHSFII